MLDAGFESPKVKSEQSKKQFLREFVTISEMIGVSDCVRLVVPNLINAFNSDYYVHHDIYENYANMIFEGLHSLLRYLGREGRKKWDFPLQQVVDQGSDCSSEITDELSELESRNTGYLGVHLIFDEILFQFFQPERYRESLREEIMPKAIELLADIAAVFSSSDREYKIIPLILDCMNDEENESRRLASIKLLDSTVKILGADAVKENIIYDYVQMQDDPIHEIRKELILKMLQISELLGQQIFVGVMLPVYRKLAVDPIWSVRKACVEILPGIQ